MAVGVGIAAGMTIISYFPVTPSRVAVIREIPSPTPVTKPDGETIAIVSSELDQVTFPVTSAVLPSEYVATAASCSVPPISIELLGAVTKTDTAKGINLGVGAGGNGAGVGVVVTGVGVDGVKMPPPPPPPPSPLGGA